MPCHRQLYLGDVLGVGLRGCRAGLIVFARSLRQVFIGHASKLALTLNLAIEKPSREWVHSLTPRSLPLGATL
jgi:hypothetical protein